MFSIRKEQTLKELVEAFYENPHHQWIKSNRYIKATFGELFDLMGPVELRKILNERKTHFIAVDGKFACAIDGNHCILVFPELKNLLQSSVKSSALAVLAHEIGHIVSRHGEKVLSYLEAQIEADRFVCRLGLEDELENFLLDMPESIEKRVRLSYLTSRHFSEH